MLESNSSQKKQKIAIEFQQFRKYCKHICECLNKIEGYSSHYRVSDKPWLKQHDGEYLQIQYRGAFPIIKINILYSLPYRIPILFFMAFDEELTPIKSQVLGTFFQKLGTGQLLHAANFQTGVYIGHNPITKQYMYTLHSCELSMQINYLVPYYFSLLNLHPELGSKQQ